MALSDATRDGHLETVKEILKRVAVCVEESVVGDLHAEALQNAAFAGHKEIVAKVLDEGADVNFRGGRYGNALQAAILGGSIDAVECVISQGADVNAEGGPFETETALHAATREGLREIATKLLAEGARADKQNLDGVYPLHLAVLHGHHEIANDLLPKSTHLLASIKASQWRDCHGDGNDHLELYFDPVPAI
ncbi:ankyrin repeat protein [Colletotrichum kahawae]|uniref:Ankyrin repeat protein n=1 Tax=Colletotrichum kahawae TaxID=34407 RepID=A0AAE0D9L4_COLKA|nr:ankyrin repeat protein [Colletotrichum kahawae]